MLDDQTIYLISTEYQIKKKKKTTVPNKTKKEYPTDVI